MINGHVVHCQMLLDGTDIWDCTHGPNVHGHFGKSKYQEGCFGMDQNVLADVWIGPNVLPGSWQENQVVKW